MSDDLIYSSERGDLRKNKPKKNETEVDESQVRLEVRRLTSGRGRTVIEIKGLPNNKSWCKKLAKELKKKIGVGSLTKRFYRSSWRKI